MTATRLATSRICSLRAASCGDDSVAATSATAVPGACSRREVNGVSGPGGKGGARKLCTGGFSYTSASGFFTSPTAEFSRRSRYASGYVLRVERLRAAAVERRPISRAMPRGLRGAAFFGGGRLRLLGVVLVAAFRPFGVALDLPFGVLTLAGAPKSSSLSSSASPSSALSSAASASPSPSLAADAADAAPPST
jgi:hypothetical protein